MSAAASADATPDAAANFFTKTSENTLNSIEIAN